MNITKNPIQESRRFPILLSNMTYLMDNIYIFFFADLILSMLFFGS